MNKGTALTGSGEAPAQVEPQEPPPISFSNFLENTPPGISQRIFDLAARAQSGRYEISKPDVKLFCSSCQGDRNFNCVRASFAIEDVSDINDVGHYYLIYACRDCRKRIKQFSVNCVRLEDNAGKATKYGEIPGFKIIVPKKLEDLFDKDLDTFRKGLKCEADGLGIGAFSYYRRVVENARDTIVDEICKACQSTNEEPALIEKLAAQKGQFRFQNSVDNIKDLLPRSFYIEGHNPLTALHGALSGHIHEKTDAECLQLASMVRLVLSSLVERVDSLRKDHSELKKAIGNLAQISGKKKTS